MGQTRDPREGQNDFLGTKSGSASRLTWMALEDPVQCKAAHAGHWRTPLLKGARGVQLIQAGRVGARAAGGAGGFVVVGRASGAEVRKPWRWMVVMAA